jgi:4'-phosphopantetheinyl transferase
MAATVHVWTINLDTDPATVSSLLDLLTGEERVRAARFRTTELRLRFIAGRGALRSILACYLGVAPGQIRIDTTAAGKPFVIGSDLSFNLSHSDGLAVCGVTTGGQLGIDVERMRRVEDSDSIVKRYFAPGELKQYESMRPAARTAAFFSAWTRKEAFVKATGAGLQRELNSFEVDLSPQATCPRLLLPAAESDVTWSLRSFAPGPQYVAAVALDREIEALEFFQWSAVTPIAASVREIGFA